MSSRKSRLFEHWIRNSLVVLGTAVAAGCKSGDVVDPGPGSVSLSIATSSATVVQGGSQLVTATLTRYGNFSGAVDLTVTGAPSGVTASVSNVQTTGAVTTATVTILVDAAVAPAVYPLVVRATGSGVGEARQAFSLTVAPPPSILLSLSTGSGSVWQGNGMTLLANLVRAGGFSGSVNVTVSGAPPGVTATVYVGPTLGAVTTAYVWINVDAATLPGVYSLVVHGTGSGGSEATATFTLTTTVPGFALTLSSPTLSIVRGAVPQTATVNVGRATFTGVVTFDVYGDADEEGALPPEVTATFGPNPTAGNSSVLAVAVSAAAVPGVYNLYILGQTLGGSGGYASTTLTLTIASPPPGGAELRLVQATASLGPVDVEVGGVTVIHGVAYGTTSRLVQVPGGTQRVRVRAGSQTIGEVDRALDLQQVNLLVVSNGTLQFSEVVTPDTGQAISNRANLRMVNVVGSSTQVPTLLDVLIKAPNANPDSVIRLGMDAQIGSYGTRMYFDPGHFSFQYVPHGGSTVLAEISFDVVAGETKAVVLERLADGSYRVQVLVEQ